jgi:hypothetical protein
MTAYVKRNQSGHSDSGGCVIAEFVTDDEMNRILSALSTLAPSAAPSDEATTIIREMLRLSEMGFEASMQEPEENGNYAVYERAKRYLAALASPSAEAAQPVAQWHPGVMRALSEKSTQTSDAIVAYKAENAKNGWTGRGLYFDGGCLNLGKDGSAEFVFDMDDCDPYYEEGKSLMLAKVPASEIEFLRDYLVKAFPAAALSLLSAKGGET